MSFKEIFFLVLTTVCYLHLSAVTPENLNLADLPLEMTAVNSSFHSLQGKLVQVRGFWFPISSEEGLLVSQPNLKSCCLTTSNRTHPKLVVKGTIASIPAQKVVMLEGIFKIHLQYGSDGEFIQVFFLEEAKEISQSRVSFSLIWIGLFIFFLFFWWMFKYKSK